MEQRQNNIYTDKSWMNSRKIVSTMATTFMLLLGATDLIAETQFEGTLKGVTITDATGTNTPPIAKIGYVRNGDTFNFDAGESFDSDGNIIKYRWDFADGNKISGRTASFTPNSDAPFGVTLTVIDNDSGASLSHEQISMSDNLLLLATQSADIAYTTPVALYGDTNRIVGQTFTTTQAGIAQSVVVYSTTTAPSNLTVRIGESADLSKTYLAEGTFAYDGKVSGEITIPLDTGASLATGKIYYLSVYSDAAAYRNRLTLRGSSNRLYSDGGYITTTSGWPLSTPSTSIDLYFKVLGSL